MEEKRINDDWNDDGDRTLSDSWTGFTKFALLNEKPLSGSLWSGRRLTKIQATTRPDCLWPEIWIGMSKAAKKQEKQARVSFVDLTFRELVCLGFCTPVVGLCRRGVLQSILMKNLHFQHCDILFPCVSVVACSYCTRPQSRLQTRYPTPRLCVL